MLITSVYSMNGKQSKYGWQCLLFSMIFRLHARGNHKTRFMIYIPLQNCFGNDNAFADTVMFTNLCHMIKEVVMIFKTNLQTTVVTYRQFFVTCIKHRNGFMIKTKKYRFIERHLGGV